jgi:hypothetical protein
MSLSMDDREERKGILQKTIAVELKKLDMESER